MTALPIESIRDVFGSQLGTQPLVVSSATGSGKSTQVPRWCRPRGRVAVIEPRRVACRSLAGRVAELEGEMLGQGVGYIVRDAARANSRTEVVFMTPGVALRMLDALADFETVILDEFHERRLDTDLLLALLRERRNDLVVMSATVDGDALAAHLKGKHLRAEGRAFPVEVRYQSDGHLLPSERDLARRVAQAVGSLDDTQGDVLVFLPGKGEIAAAERALRNPHAWEVVSLHGTMPLPDQARVFAPSKLRKLILATNVAETSLTIPGVGVVIDSGLVRRTHYHEGRSYLTLSAIAQDSAEQRTGRAGRTAAGMAVRLWDRAAQLEPRTPPEMFRESLVPLVLGAAAHGAPVDTLAFVDPPKDHAVAAARGDLEALGALDDAGHITDVGQQLFNLPLDPAQGRWLVEARAQGNLQEMIDLVAALSVGRSLFVAKGDESAFREDGCDALAILRAVRFGTPSDAGVSNAALRDARQRAHRLREAFSLPAPDPHVPIDRHRLALTVLGADPRSAYVARHRRGRVVFGNGGTEIEVGGESCVNAAEVQAIAVLEVRGVGERRKRRILATAAMPLPLAWMVEAGLGRDRLGSVDVEGESVVAKIERVYAKRVLTCIRREPKGALAREAIGALFLRGTIFREALAEARERLRATALLHQLNTSPLGRSLGLPQSEAPPSLEAWVRLRLEALGVSTGSDLALLGADDLVPADIPAEYRALVDREFPRTVSLGDCTYEADYDLPRRRVHLRWVRGHRQGPPARLYLPKFGGLQVWFDTGGTTQRLK